MINSLGPVQPSADKKKKWFSCRNNVKQDSNALEVTLMMSPAH